MIDIEEVREFFKNKSGGIYTQRLNVDHLRKLGKEEWLGVLLNHTAFAPEYTISDRAYFFIHNMAEIPRCARDECQNRVKFNKGHFPKCCSARCAQLLPETKEKLAATNIKRFGVDNIFKSEKFKQELKNNLMEEYGVENISQTPHVREKIKAAFKHNYTDNRENYDALQEKRKKTCMERYGVEHPLASDEINEKIKNTMLERYGCERAFQNKDSHQKFKDTMVERYGIDNFNRQLTIGIPQLEDREKLKEMTDTMTMTEIASILGVSKTTVGIRVKEFDIPYEKKYYSVLETEMIAAIREVYQGELVLRSNDIIPPYEIDILIPEFNIAIECNGVSWHSEIMGRKDKNYHLIKSRKCRQQNIRLIHVFENDWYNKQEIIKSIIFNSIGAVNRRIYARKCEVREITSTKEVREFLNDNHLKGYNTKSIIKVGLYYEGELVSLITFCNPRYGKDHDYEVLRSCTKVGCNVVGGFSKIMNYFKKTYCDGNTRVMSYCDASMYRGVSYEKYGFQFDSFTPPSYKYFKGNYRYMMDRTKFQKKKLKQMLPIYDENITEWENMKANGYDRIWDCGNSKWIITL